MTTQELTNTKSATNHSVLKKRDANYVFHELTRSICPKCRRVIDAQVILRDNKVYMRKRCPECGPFESLVYGDAEAYVSFGRYNKPGTIPLAHGTAVDAGCPYDCGSCPDHQQHACLGIIEVNSTCNMYCPLCFSEAGPGFNLTIEEVEQMLDELVRTEGQPEVVQFSGGEPTIHPHIIDFVRAAKDRNIPFVMINTNGRRIARDDRFLEQLNEVRPSLYFQFDGFDSETYRILRGEPDILGEKLRALDRLALIGLSVTLVPAIERGVCKYLIYDRDAKFSSQVSEMVRSLNLKTVRTSFRSPWQNGVAERWVGSCRRDLLDHVIPLGERHLKRLLADYVRYFHQDRTHLGLQKDTPHHRPLAEPGEKSIILSFPRVGGLHHRYDVAA